MLNNQPKALELARILETAASTVASGAATALQSSIHDETIRLSAGPLGPLRLQLRLALALGPLLAAYFLRAPQSWLQVLGAGLLLAASTALAALLSVRRLHDLYLSGWYALVLLVPLANLLAYVLLASAARYPRPEPLGAAPGAQLVPVPVRVPVRNEAPARRWWPARRSAARRHA